MVGRSPGPQALSDDDSPKKEKKDRGLKRKGGKDNEEEGHQEQKPLTYKEMAKMASRAKASGQKVLSAMAVVLPTLSATLAEAEIPNLRDKVPGYIMEEAQKKECELIRLRNLWEPTLRGADTTADLIETLGSIGEAKSTLERFSAMLDIARSYGS